MFCFVFNPHPRASENMLRERKGKKERERSRGGVERETREKG